MSESSILISHLTGEGTPLPLGLAGYPNELQGKPVHFRRKEVIRAGQWTHRGSREPFDIDRARMDAWVSAFNRRLANGIKPFVPDHHTEEPKAGENFGYVVGMNREGDSLYADLQLIGDEALALAAKNDVSVYVKAEGIDANGNAYGEHLHHLALTPNPNQPNLGPFVTIAASADTSAVEAPVFELSTSGLVPERRTPMFKPDTLEKLRVKFQGTKAEKLTDDQLADAIASLALADPPADLAPQVTALSADVTRLTTELAAEKTAKESATLALSAAQPHATDPEILRDRAENYVGKIEVMRDRGDMPAFVADKLMARLKPGTSPVLMLSASAELDNKRPMDFVLSLFDGAKLGITTGNGVPRGDATSILALDGNTKPMTDARRKELADQMGLKLSA